MAKRLTNLIDILPWTLHSVDHNILFYWSLVRLIGQFTPVLTLCDDPFGVDVPLNFDITHTNQLEDKFASAFVSITEEHFLSPLSLAFVARWAHSFCFPLTFVARLEHTFCLRFNLMWHTVCIML